MLSLLLLNQKKIQPIKEGWFSAILKAKRQFSELFRDVSPKIAERPGGYTRILKTGNRIGDNAEMCIIELVDYNEAMLGVDKTKAKATRRKRAPKKKVDSTVSETASETPAVEPKAKKAAASKEKSE